MQVRGPVPRSRRALPSAATALAAACPLPVAALWIILALLAPPGLGRCASIDPAGVGEDGDLPRVPAISEVPGADTQEIFERFSDLVVQIQVVEAGSGARAGIGSGFVVSHDGHIVTNFHVIAELVHHAERYRGEFLDASGEARPIRLLALDVVHDLAVVKADQDFRDYLKIEAKVPAKGARIYSLGNPYDLGLSIVEGTYNGLLEHSLWEKIHFTGSINPGMSGGPALEASGGVVGVNVATAGNQVSFLVPAQRVEALLERTLAPGFEPSDDFGEVIRTQLVARQEAYLSGLLTGPAETVQLGHYEVPSKLAPFFNCWGDAVPDEDELFEARIHQCATDDSVYVSRELRSSIISLRHRQLQSDRLNPARFYQLYTMYFEGNHSQLPGGEEDFSPFRCETDFVDNGSLTFKATFCVRRYRKFEGLYDAVFKAAALGRDDSGLETALVLSAVSFENAQRLARRYLEAIRWQE